MLPSNYRDLDIRLVACTCLLLASKVEGCAQDATPFDLQLVLESCSHKINEENARRAEAVVCKELGWNLHQKTPLSISLFLLEQFAVSKGQKSRSLNREVITYLQEFLKVAMADSKLAATCSLVSVAFAAAICIFDLCRAQDSIQLFVDLWRDIIRPEIDNVNTTRSMILYTVAEELKREGNEELSAYLRDQTKVPVNVDSGSMNIEEKQDEEAARSAEGQKMLSSYSTSCSLDNRLSKLAQDKNSPRDSDKQAHVQEIEGNDRLSSKSDTKYLKKGTKKKANCFASIKKLRTPSRDHLATRLPSKKGYS